MEVKLREVTWLGRSHKGNYNGYVKIDKDSPFYYKGYDELLPFTWDEENKVMTTNNFKSLERLSSMGDILEVHGGITYAEFDRTDEDFNPKDEQSYWIGWDSCHSGDEGRFPYEVAMEETMRLAKQIENINKLWKAHTTYTNSQTATWHLLKA